MEDPSCGRHSAAFVPGFKTLFSLRSLTRIGCNVTVYNRKTLSASFTAHLLGTLIRLSLGVDC